MPHSDSRFRYPCLCAVRYRDESSIGSGCSGRSGGTVVRSCSLLDLISVRGDLQDQTVIRPVMRSMDG